MPDEGRESIVSERKKCPVDRGKLLIGLECCRIGWAENCKACPYFNSRCDTKLMDDALAYIGWLEEKLEGLGNAETD